jgi:hypothetical protein
MRALSRGHPCTTHQTYIQHRRLALQQAQLRSRQCRKNTEKLKAGKAKRTASKIKADAERAAKLATALEARKESVANRTEEEVENEKAARAVRAAQREKDRDRKLADIVDNLVEGRRAGSGRVRMPSALSLNANYGQWNERSGD